MFKTYKVISATVNILSATNQFRLRCYQNNVIRLWHCLYTVIR